ncbi:MAG: 16S rRNA (adenine(1518)-N(6)/adenine(1519)-N(6))-dimethyltransferase RsmA [Bacteroidales bacterium]|nr:16S rRNA (adenine(1518)-N(6)/adenine(1519)-N(6))-dimethyltransferase RsmA [Bacteroidales bacterium]MCM1415550.1 16S rRNA (adenine(1518)-N(6)/adenine(1519)-N(6))-dimethyltransferase RsmA [bacterium]MCM1424383.1 16S rRNA (adenine(1518)-N(6)/adenine(1519)-N(6))-dimethyltransferase RsmA [bacterium]
MADLGNFTNTSKILNKYQFRMQKKYGQNFLIDANILTKIVEAAQIGKEDCVLEIGPGIGTMTQYLAEAAGRVIAVEIDRELIPILEETLAPYTNVTVLCADILKVNLTELVNENGGSPLKVVANLPYYITTPIIMALFESHVPLSSITVMVQSEVAERMQTGPGTKDYGALSLAVQYYAKPEIVARVPASCFTPRPNVDSAVVRLERHEEPPVAVKDEEWLFALIRASFNQRRKTLANGLANAGGLGLTRGQVESVLEEMGLSKTVRGETLTLERVAELSNRLLPFRNGGGFR